MDMERIYLLFEEITGADPEKNPLIIERAVENIRNRVKRSEYIMHKEVEYLIALYAALALYEKETASGITEVTEGGGVIKAKGKNYRLEMAKKMIAEQEKVCSGYVEKLPDSSFLFFSVKGGC